MKFTVSALDQSFLQHDAALPASARGVDPPATPSRRAGRTARARLSTASGATCRAKAQHTAASVTGAGPTDGPTNQAPLNGSIKRFGVGARVVERNYGSGSVVAVEHAHAHVQFDEHAAGKKFLIISMSRLEPSDAPVPAGLHGKLKALKSAAKKAAIAAGEAAEEQPRQPGQQAIHLNRSRLKRRSPFDCEAKSTLQDRMGKGKSSDKEAPRFVGADPEKMSSYYRKDFKPGERGANVDTVQTYLNEIRTVELLDRASEVKLGKQIHRGRSLVFKGLSRAPATADAILELGRAVSRDKRPRKASSIVIFAKKEHLSAESRKHRFLIYVAAVRKALKHVLLCQETLNATPDGQQAYRCALSQLRRAQVRLSLCIRKMELSEKERLKLLRAVRESAQNGDERQVAALKKIDRGEKLAKSAKDELITANLRLVISEGNKNSYKHYKHLTPMDLWQEGNVSLLEAAERWDYRLGYKFSTYAVPWIENHIKGAKAKEYTLYRPDHVLRRISAVKEAEREIGGEPSVEAVAEWLEWTVADTREAIRERDALRVKSFDVPIQGKDDLNDGLGNGLGAEPDWDTAGGVVEDDSSSSLANEKLRHGVIDDLSQTLEPQQQKIIEMLFGLDGSSPQSHARVGSSLGMSGEHVKQLEAEALCKLKEAPPVRVVHEPEMSPCLLSRRPDVASAGARQYGHNYTYGVIWYAHRDAKPLLPDDWTWAQRYIWQWLSRRGGVPKGPRHVEY